MKIKTNGDEEKEDLKQEFKYINDRALEKIDNEIENKLEEELDNVNNDSCLNIMVTAYFL